MAVQDSNNHTSHLHADIGSDRKAELQDHVDNTELSLTDATKEAVDLYLKEVNGERVERANISRLSPYDMFAVSMYVGAIMSGVLTLAGQSMLQYTIAFALSGMAVWIVEYRTTGQIGMVEADSA